MNPNVKAAGILQLGIITEKLIESKEFFQKWLGWQVKFESEWFLLLSHPEKEDREIAFMLPDQAAVRKSYFQRPYGGEGIWLIIESEDIESLYEICAGELPLIFRSQKKTGVISILQWSIPMESALTLFN